MTILTATTQTSVYFDSINRPRDMILTAHELGMSGLALTDHECLCGHVEFLKEEKDLKEKGLIPQDFKCGLGNEIYLVEDRHNIERYWHYILIAKNNTGHRALRELSSIAWYNGYNSKGMMRVPTEMKELEEIVKKYPNSLISSIACFTAGTKVLTKDGEKNIEDITNNDYIFNRYGEWEKVNFPTKVYYEGAGKKITFFGNDIPTICTEDHKFLIKSKNGDKVDWVEAKNLKNKNGSNIGSCLRPIINNYDSEKKYSSKNYITINNVLYEKIYIKKIENINLKENVYCLNVDSHSFLCNKVIVHNCIGGFVSSHIVQLAKEEENNNPNKEKIYNLKKQIDEFVKWNINLFGDDFYFEIAAGTAKDQKLLNQRIKSVAKAYNRKIVIGSDSHFLTSKERPIHKAYLNSKEGEREVDEFYWDAHMMDNEEAYNNLKDIYTEDEFIEICNNSMEIYNKIEGYNLHHNPIIPEVVVKTYPKKNKKIEIAPTLTKLFCSDEVQERAWINMCWDSLVEKGLDKKENYIRRLEEEASIIYDLSSKIGDCLYKYFNTFQHYIDLFWDCGSIVGPGRGSSGAFLSNYLLGITQADPIIFGFPEWRFLNREKVELPDVDTDLSPSRKKIIFDKIREERGELNLIQVCTFGTEGTRSAIAAAGRGYRSEQYPNGLSVEETQYLSSLIPVERGFLRSIKDCVYGNEEKDWKPIQPLIDELNKYPGLLEIIETIEGIVCRRGIHASGVIMYNNNPYETGALMRSPNGELTTQFSLHDAELCGDTKFDFLMTEICDKLTTCLSLLQNDNLIDKNLSLREIYNTYLHPDKIDMTDTTLWNALDEGKVMDVFQFNTGVGLAAVKQAQPKTLTEMISTNALIRLAPEQGEERPLDKYCRFKKNINLWYEEVKNYGLTEEEIKILEKHYLPRYGVCCSQEDLMRICMDPNIANFSLTDANYAKKVVSKKKIKEVPALKEKFINSCKSKTLGEYIWKTTMQLQMSYA